MMRFGSAIRAARAAGGMLRQAAQRWSADNASQLAAAVSFYAIFSLAPLLIIAIAIAGMVFGERAARHEIVNMLSGTIGEPAAQTVEHAVFTIKRSGRSGTALAVGIAAVALGSMGVFLQLQQSLNRIWAVRPRPSLGAYSFLRKRAISFAMVMLTGVLLLVSLLASAALSATATWFDPLLPWTAWLRQGLNIAASFVISAILFALVFTVLPDARCSWRDALVGAIVTAALLAVGKQLIGMYLGHTTAASIFGAAGSVVVMLIWVYYSSMIFFFGAEFTRVWAERHGRSIQPNGQARRESSA